VNKTALPPHGYEGMRATPRFVAARPLPPLPIVTGTCPDGVEFTPVIAGQVASPVRAYQHGFSCGVFVSPEAAAATLRILASQPKQT
jgi:hypothetical protein